MCLAVPGRILELIVPDGASTLEDRTKEVLRLACVDLGGAVRRVSLAYLPDARVGDWVIVHAGFALSVLSEDEAAATLARIDALDTPRREPTS